MRRLVTAVAAAALGVGAFVTAGLAPATASARTPLGAEPGWVKAANRRGSAPSSDVVSLRVVLATRNAAEAESVARAVSDPKSPDYGHYLTAAQYRARFAPTAASVDAVKKWLRASGFQVGYVPANHLYVAAIGTVAQAEKAFAVHLSKYAVKGQVLRAPDSEPSVPAELASAVVGAVGLDQSGQLIHPNTSSDAAASPNAPPPYGFRNAQPCSAYYGEKMATDQAPLNHGFPTVVPYAPCGYKPTQLRAAYGVEAAVANGNDGSGVTVGIVDAFAARTIFRDAKEYSQRNDPTHVLRASQFSQIVPPGIYRVRKGNECGPQGWYGEETLDVEAVHAMAPGANIVYSGAADCFDNNIDAALNNLVDGNKVDMVSNSYGDIGEDISKALKKEFDQIANQAAVQGIGLYFSSGDDGDETGNLSRPETDFSADSGMITAVGGTTTGINRDGKVSLAAGWSTTRISQKASGLWKRPPGDFYYAAGGGTSRLYSEPYYQHGVVPDALAKQWSNHRGRVVPDVAMNADPTTGMLVGETQQFPDGTYYDQYRIGGTSLASPLFTGVMALADQRAGKRHGFANPKLYRLANTAAFNDVKPLTSPLALIRADYAQRHRREQRHRLLCSRRRQRGAVAARHEGLRHAHRDGYPERRDVPDAHGALSGRVPSGPARARPGMAGPTALVTSARP